jgi:hypothetical protein
MEVSGQLHGPAALPPGEGVTSTHWIGYCVGPRTGSDGVELRIEPRPSSRQPVAIPTEPFWVVYRYWQFTYSREQNHIWEANIRTDGQEMAFLGTSRFITVFTHTRALCLFKLHFKLSSNLLPGFLFSLVFRTTIFFMNFSSLHKSYMFHPCHTPSFIHWSVGLYITKLFIMEMKPDISSPLAVFRGGRKHPLPANKHVLTRASIPAKLGAVKFVSVSFYPASSTYILTFCSLENASVHKSMFKAAFRAILRCGMIRGENSPHMFR